MADAPGGFAETLRHAIDQRGLGLERIKERLEDRGVSVSVATLSYWQSGRSQPERKQSLAAIPHLETVLGLPSGNLQRALDGHRCRKRRCQVVDLDSVWPEVPHTRVLHSLDTTWDAELDRVSLHDVLTIGADRCLRSMRTHQVLRARTEGADRAILLHAQDDTGASLPEIRVLHGARLGKVVSDRAGGVIGAELVFLQPLRRGQTVVLEHELVSEAPRPHDQRYERRPRLPLRQYLLEVRFDPAETPATCTTVDGEDGPQPLELDPTGCVHLFATDLAAGPTGIRWQWATPAPSS